MLAFFREKVWYEEVPSQYLSLHFPQVMTQEWEPPHHHLVKDGTETPDVDLLAIIWLAPQNLRGHVRYSTAERTEFVRILFAKAEIG